MSEWLGAALRPLHGGDGLNAENKFYILRDVKTRGTLIEMTASDTGPETKFLLCRCPTMFVLTTCVPEDNVRWAVKMCPISLNWSKKVTLLSGRQCFFKESLFLFSFPNSSQEISFVNIWTGSGLPHNEYKSPHMTDFAVLLWLRKKSFILLLLCAIGFFSM